MGSFSARTASLAAVLGLGVALGCGPVHGDEGTQLNVSAVVLPRSACRVAWDGTGRLAADTDTAEPSRTLRCDGSTATYQDVAVSVAAQRARLSDDAAVLTIEF